MNTNNFTQGTTAPQDFQLVTVDAAGVATPFDATAGGPVAVFTVDLVLVSHATGLPVTTAGDVAWLDPETGTVRYAPDADALLAASSPYDARWKVTDEGGLVAFFPDGIADRWVVRL